MRFAANDNRTITIGFFQKGSTGNDDFCDTFHWSIRYATRLNDCFVLHKNDIVALPPDVYQNIEWPFKSPISETTNLSTSCRLLQLLHLHHHQREMSDTSSNTEAEPQEVSVISDLSESIVKQLSTVPFACGGSFDLSESTSCVQIRFGPQGQGSLLTFPVEQTQAEALRTLLASCSAAPFGRAGKEVLDDDYRKASKLDVNEFVTDFCPYKTGIIDVVAQLLLPSVESEPRGVEVSLISGICLR